MADNQPGSIVDPYRNYNFKIDLGRNRGECFFSECSGLGVEVESIEYREGGAGHVTRQIPGRVSYSAVTLRFGVSDSDMLWSWLQSSIEGRVERENISIQMLTSDGKPGFHWNLMEAWPKSWKAAPLDAMGKEIAIESLTLVYQELKREKS